MNKQLTIARQISIPLLAGLSLYLVFSHWKYFPAEYLIRKDFVNTPGVIVVTGGYYGMIAKLLAVNDLYKNNHVKKIIIPAELKINGLEDLKKTGVHWPSPIDISISVLKQLGIPQKLILTQPQYTNGTFGEAVEIQKLLKNSDYSHVILVTDQYHSRRAYLTFTGQLEPLGIKVSSFPSSYDKINPKEWWVYKRDRSYVFSEWLKLVYYKFIIKAFTTNYSQS